MAAIPISIAMFFLIYWILPNCEVPAARVLPVSIVVGLTQELHEIHAASGKRLDAVPRQVVQRMCTVS